MLGCFTQVVLLSHLASAQGSRPCPQQESWQAGTGRCCKNDVFALCSCASSSAAPAAPFGGSYLVVCEQTARCEHIAEASHTAAGTWTMGTGWSPGSRGVAHRAPGMGTPESTEEQSHPQKALHIQRDSPTSVFSLHLTNHTA